MVIGHRRQIHYLERALAKGALAHAYLFHGPEAVGKKTVALALARSLLCVRPPSRLGGCGECEDCRLVGTGAHPDFAALSFAQPLVSDESKREIGIKNIHELQHRLSLALWRGGRKVVLIDGAELLSRDASAALLKTLEEPDQRTVFILVTPSAGSLLETIRSRCVLIGFTTISAEGLEFMLAKVPRGERPRYLALADGRPGLLHRLVSDRAFFEGCRAQAAGFARVASADLREQFNFSDERGREPGELEAFLGRLIRNLRGELVAALSGQADHGRVGRLAGFLVGVLQRHALLADTAVNRRLLADSVFFELSSLALEVRP